MGRGFKTSWRTPSHQVWCLLPHYLPMYNNWENVGPSAEPGERWTSRNQPLVPEEGIVVWHMSGARLLSQSLTFHISFFTEPKYTGGRHPYSAHPLCLSPSQACDRGLRGGEGGQGLEADLQQALDSQEFPRGLWHVRLPCREDLQP